MPRRIDRRHLDQFKQSRNRHPDWPVILSEGDSWFAFPLYHNTITHLEGMGRFTLLRREGSGDEILTILSGPQKSRLTALLKKYPFDAIVFSGGGNDVLGPNLFPLVRKREEGMGWEDCLRKQRIQRRFRQIRDAYLDLVQLRDDHRPGCRIVAHGYDYPIPSKKGAKLLGWKVAGPWLWPCMEQSRITNKRDQVLLAKWLIDEFSAVMVGLASTQKDFTYVPTPGTLGKDDWGDEIHPSSAGFKKIAEKLRGTLDGLFPGSFSSGS